VEAPLTEGMFLQYDESVLEVVAIGTDWNQPYSCEEWGTAFGLSYPILDDISNIYGLFGTGYIPHNIIVGGDGEVLFSESGFNQTTILSYINQGITNLVLDVDADGIFDDNDNCIEAYNPEQEDTDNDLIGDACDACNNLIWTGGDVNGDLNISLEDILILVDIIVGDNNNQCGYEAGNVNGDGVINIMDVVRLVQLIIGGNQQQALQYLKQMIHPKEFKQLTKGFASIDALLLLAYPNPSNGNVSIIGDGLVSIYNINGRLVLQTNISNNYRWDTKDAPTGIYYIVNNAKTIKITLLK
tara:strand:+ start:644 stop:1540 length:897 start_codon:yes stop_codon:yes gene_type:complete